MQGGNVDVKIFQFRVFFDVCCVSFNPAFAVVILTLDVIVRVVAISEKNPAARENVKSQHELENGREYDLEVGLGVLHFERKLFVQKVFYLSLGHR